MTRIWSLLLAGGVLWTAAVTLAPVLDSPAIYDAAGLICHQLLERSFHLGARPMAVCARCLGLYAGGIAGLLVGAWAILTQSRATGLTPLRARTLVGVAALPTVATLLAEWLLAWPVGNVARFVAAVPLSSAAAFAVAATMAAEPAGPSPNPRQNLRANPRANQSQSLSANPSTEPSSAPSCEPVTKPPSPPS